MLDNTISSILAQAEHIRRYTDLLGVLNAEMHSQPVVETFSKYLGKKVRVKFLNLHDNTESALEGRLIGANTYTIEIKSQHPSMTSEIYIDRLTDFEVLDK